MPYFDTFKNAWRGYFNISNTPSIEAQIRMQERALNRMGVTPPPMVKRSMVDRIFDALNIGQYAVMGALRNITDNDPNTTIVQGILEGLKAGNPFGQGYEKGEAQFSDVLTNLGWEGKPTQDGKLSWSQLGKGAVSLAGDILLDPLNYVTFGTASLLKGTKAGKKVMPEAYKEAIERLSQGGAEEILKRFDQPVELAEGLVNKIRRLAGEDFSKTKGLSVFGKELVSAEKLQEIGEKTIAPYTSKYFDFASKKLDKLTEGIKKVFTSEESLRLKKLARENPEEVAKLIGLSMQYSDKLKAFGVMQKEFAEKAIDMFKNIPENVQKAMTDVLEDPNAWRDVITNISAGTTLELTPKAKEFYNGLIELKSKYSNLLDNYNKLPDAQEKIKKLTEISNAIDTILKSRARTYEGLIKATSDVLAPIKELNQKNLYDFLNKFVNLDANGIFGVLKKENPFGLSDDIYRQMSFEIRAVLDQYQDKNISKIARKFYEKTEPRSAIRNIDKLSSAKYFGLDELRDEISERILRNKQTYDELIREGKRLEKIAREIVNVLDDNEAYDNFYRVVLSKNKSKEEVDKILKDIKKKSFVFDEQTIRALLATEGYTEEQIDTIFQRVAYIKRLRSWEVEDEVTTTLLDNYTYFKGKALPLDKTKEHQIYKKNYRWIDKGDDIIRREAKNAEEIAFIKQFDTGIDNAKKAEEVRRFLSTKPRSGYAGEDNILEQIREKAEKYYKADSRRTKADVVDFINKQLENTGFTYNDYIKYIGSKPKKYTSLFDYYDNKIKEQLRLGNRKYIKQNIPAKRIDNLIFEKKMQIVDILDNLGVKSDDVTKYFINSVEAHKMIDMAIEDGGLRLEDAVKYAYNDYMQRYGDRIKALTSATKPKTATKSLEDNIINALRSGKYSDEQIIASIKKNAPHIENPQKVLEFYKNKIKNEPKFFAGNKTDKIPVGLKPKQTKQVVYDIFDVHGVKVNVERGANIKIEDIIKNIEDISRVNNKFAKALTDLNIHVINSDEVYEGAILGKHIIMPNTKLAGEKAQQKVKVIFNHEFGHYMQDILGIKGDYEEFANAFGQYLLNPSKFSDFAKNNPAMFEKIDKAVRNFEPTREQYINLHAAKIKESAYRDITPSKATLDDIIRKHQEEVDSIINVIQKEGLSYEETLELLNKINDEEKNWTILFNEKYPEEAVYENVEQFIQANRKKFRENFNKHFDQNTIDVMETVLNDFLRWGAEEGIPKERLLQAYAPHMLSSKLKEVNPEELVKIREKALQKGTQENKYRLANMFALERKHPGTIREINAYMKKEYGIDNWFEHRLGQLYLQRGLKHNQLVFDKVFYNDLTKHFGIRIDDVNKIPVNKKMVASIEDIGEILALVDEKDIEKTLESLGLPKKLLTDKFTPLVTIDTNAFVKLKNMNKNFYAVAIDDTVYDLINKMGKLQFDDTRNAFLKAYDTFLGLWKLNNTSVILGFHARNAISNVFQEYLAVGSTALDLDVQASAFKIISTRTALGDDLGLEGVITAVNGKTYTLDEIRKLAIKLNVIESGFWKTDFATGMLDNPLQKLYADISKQNKINLNPLSRQFALYRAGSAIGSVVEGQARLANFIANLKLGKDPFEAADMVQRFMFDYTDLSKWERDVFKRIIPFYTWMRKNIPLQLEQLMNQPETYRNLSKMLNAVKGLTPPDERISKQDMNEFAREWLQLPIKTKNKKGKEEPVFWNPNLPYGDLEKIDITELPKNVFTSMSPFIKLPIEILANKNVYFNSPISRGIGDTADAPGYLNALLGGTKDEPAQMNPYVRYALQNIGSLENLSKLISYSNERAEGQLMSDRAIAALNALGGIKLYSYDVDKYREWALRDRLKQLRDLRKKEEKKRRKSN